jgi:hypothetical protein
VHEPVADDDVVVRVELDGRRTASVAAGCQQLVDGGLAHLHHPVDLAAFKIGKRNAGSLEKIHRSAALLVRVLSVCLKGGTAGPALPPQGIHDASTCPARLW